MQLKLARSLQDSISQYPAHPMKPKKITDPHTLLLPPIPSNETTRSSFEDVKFSQEAIITAIKEIKLNSAPGRDGIQTNLQLKCKGSIARPLCLLWRHTMDTSTVPAQANRVIIIPTHKGGPKGSARKL